MLSSNACGENIHTGSDGIDLGFGVQEAAVCEVGQPEKTVYSTYGKYGWTTGWPADRANQARPLAIVTGGGHEEHSRLQAAAGDVFVDGIRLGVGHLNSNGK